MIIVHKTRAWRTQVRWIGTPAHADLSAMDLAAFLKQLGLQELESLAIHPGIEQAIKFSDKATWREATQTLKLDPAKVVPVWSSPDPRHMVEAGAGARRGCLVNVGRACSEWLPTAKPVLVLLLSKLGISDSFVAYLHTVLEIDGELACVTKDQTYPEVHGEPRGELAMVRIDEIAGLRAREFVFIEEGMAKLPGAHCRLRLGKILPRRMQGIEPSSHNVRDPGCRVEELVYVAIPPAAAERAKISGTYNGVACAVDPDGVFAEVSDEHCVAYEKDSEDGHIRKVVPVRAVDRILASLVRPDKGKLCSACKHHRPLALFSVSNRKKTASKRKCRVCTDQE